MESWEGLLLVTMRLCGRWLWKWLPHRLSKRQSLTTVLLRTPITQMILFNQGKTVSDIMNCLHSVNSFVSGNKWDCNCESGLQEALENLEHVYLQDKAYCHTPEAMRGRRISDPNCGEYRGQKISGPIVAVDFPVISRSLPSRPFFYGGPQGTCCKLKSCCKQNQVAANKIKLLQILKTSYCKLKECCCKF